MEKPQGNAFEYNYSAKQQEKIEAIKRKYEPKKEDKMEQLRKLDRSVKRPGSMLGIMIGVIGSLVMGAGMSLSMVWTDTLMVPGIVLGILGILLIAAACPVYKIVTKKQREKIAPIILALSEELLK